MLLVTAALLSSQPSRRPTSNTRMVEEPDSVPPLRYLGDARLMKASASVPTDALSSDEFEAKLDGLKKAMSAYGGIGIAAPQIGCWVRVFCFGIDGGNPRYPAAEEVRRPVSIP